jgi:hypothetical protein
MFGFIFQDVVRGFSGKKMDEIGSGIHEDSINITNKVLL